MSFELVNKFIAELTPEELELLKLKLHVVGCTLCGDDFSTLKKNNNSIRYCHKCDKAV